MPEQRSYTDQEVFDILHDRDRLIEENERLRKELKELIDQLDQLNCGMI